MAGSCLKAVRQAIYSKLAADSTLQSLLGGSVASPKIYNSVPENTTYPYGVIARVAEDKSDTFGRNGRTATVTVHFWSRYAGSDQVDDAAARTAVVLDGVALTITGYEHIRTVHDHSENGIISDGVTWMAALTLTLWLRQAA